MLRLLVEAGLELHQRNDLLAPLGSTDERGDDRAVTGGPVQGELDGKDLRVPRRLADELLDRGGEAVVRMVDQQRTIRDGGEDVAELVVLERAEAALGHGDEVGVLELGTRHPVDVPQTAEVDRRGVGHHVVLGQFQFGADELQSGGGDVVLDLEPNGLAEAAAAQLHLDRGQQVVRLFVLHRQVGVAGDPEGDVIHDVHPREQLLEVLGDDLLQRDEPLAVRQHHEAGKQRRNLDAGEALLIGGGILDDDTQVERQAGDVGERVTGVHRQGREHREDPPIELLAEPLAVVVVELAPGREDDAGVGQSGDRPDRGRSRPPGPTGPARRALTSSSCSLGRTTIGAQGAHAGGDLVLESRHPDLEELIEVLAEDRQELDPFEQRRAVVLGQCQHPAVEVQPGHLAVQVGVRCDDVAHRVRHGWILPSEPRLADPPSVNVAWIRGRRRRRRRPDPQRLA